MKLEFAVPLGFPALTDAIHGAVDRIGDYLGSERPDRHELIQALDLLEAALAEYYDHLHARSLTDGTEVNHARNH